MSDDELLAMLAESDDNFNISSDEINFDDIPKKSDLKKKKDRPKMKMILPSDSDDDPFTIEEPSVSNKTQSKTQNIQKETKQEQQKENNTQNSKKEIDIIDDDFDDIFCQTSGASMMSESPSKDKGKSEKEKESPPNSKPQKRQRRSSILPVLDIFGTDTFGTLSSPQNNEDKKQNNNKENQENESETNKDQERSTTLIMHDDIVQNSVDTNKSNQKANEKQKTYVSYKQNIQNQEEEKHFVPKYVETKPSKPIDKMSPIESFEYSLLTYLERSTKDVSKSFIDEFSFLLGQAASYESTISQFLSDLNADVKKIVLEESTQIQPLPDARNDIYNTINDQFAQLSKQIPQNEGKRESIDTYSQLNSSISQSHDNFSAKCTPILIELQQEVMLATQDDQNDNKAIRETLEKQKHILAELEAYSYQQDLEQEYLSKEVQRLKQMQVAYHEKTLNMLSHENNDENKSFTNEIEALIEELNHSTNDVQDPSIQSYQEAIDQRIRELSDLNNDLISSTERIWHKVGMGMMSNDEPLYMQQNPQQQQQQQQQYFQYTPNTSMLQENRFDTRNEIVANVRERLELLRRKL